MIVPVRPTADHPAPTWFCEHEDHAPSFPVFHSDEEAARHLELEHPAYWDKLSRMIVRGPQRPS